MPQRLQFVVLPEDRWKPCPRCGQRAPEFSAFPESLKAELAAIGKKSPIGIIQRLCQEGCSLKVANTWVYHHLQFCEGPSTTPCPYCGNFLRTPKAKQCRFCGEIGMTNDRTI